MTELAEEQVKFEKETAARNEQLEKDMAEEA